MSRAQRIMGFRISGSLLHCRLAARGVIVFVAAAGFLGLDMARYSVVDANVAGGARGPSTDVSHDGGAIYVAGAEERGEVGEPRQRRHLADLPYVPPGGGGATPPAIYHYNYKPYRQGSSPDHHGKDKLWPQPLGVASNGEERSGLTLEIVNALSPSYAPYFERAVKDWQSGHVLGSNDAVRLRVRTLSQVQEAASADHGYWSRPPNCDDGVAGQSIICNGNYGNTRWIGIEITTSVSGKILRSRVKLNDYHLTGRDGPYKQYVMCHELGHAIGLNHVDENYNNANTGSCMDYARDVSTSQGPNYKDYDTLVKLYGQFPRGTAILPGNDSDGIGSIDCGCPTTCTDQFLDETYVGLDSCRTLLERYVYGVGLDEYYACYYVGSLYQVCGSMCHPDQCPDSFSAALSNPAISSNRPPSPPLEPSVQPTASPRPSQSPTVTARPSSSPTAVSERTKVRDCGCPATCTNEVLDDVNSSPMGPCRELMNYQMRINGASEWMACSMVAMHHRGCGRLCHPDWCPTVAEVAPPTLQPQADVQVRPPAAAPASGNYQEEQAGGVADGNIPPPTAPAPGNNSSRPPPPTAASPVPPSSPQVGKKDPDAPDPGESGGAAQQQQEESGGGATSATIDCGCPDTCTPSVLDGDFGGGARYGSCRSLIKYQMDVNGMDQRTACGFVASYHASCREGCHPDYCRGQNVYGSGWGYGTMNKQHDVERATADGERGEEVRSTVNGAAPSSSFTPSAPTSPQTNEGSRRRKKNSIDHESRATGHAPPSTLRGARTATNFGSTAVPNGSDAGESNSRTRTRNRKNVEENSFPTADDGDGDVSTVPLAADRAALLAVQGEIGYRAEWGDLSSVRPNGIQYRAMLADGTVEVTDVKFLLVSDVGD